MIAFAEGGIERVVDPDGMRHYYHTTDYPGGYTRHEFTLTEYG